MDWFRHFPISPILQNSLPESCWIAWGVDMGLSCVAIKRNFFYNSSDRSNRSTALLLARRSRTSDCAFGATSALPTFSEEMLFRIEKCDIWSRVKIIIAYIIYIAAFCCFGPSIIIKTLSCTLQALDISIRRTAWIVPPCTLFSHLDVGTWFGCKFRKWILWQVQFIVSMPVSM